MQSTSRNRLLMNIFIYIVAFSLTYMIFLPFNTLLKATLNTRLYPFYIILFLTGIFILFQKMLFSPKSCSRISNYIIFGVCSGYVTSIIASVGMNLIVLNKLFIPSDLNNVFLLFVFAPFFLFGWLYGLVMSILLYYLRRYTKK